MLSNLKIFTVGKELQLLIKSVGGGGVLCKKTYSCEIIDK